MRSKLILVFLGFALLVSLIPACGSIPPDDELSLPLLWTYDLNSTCLEGPAAGDIDSDGMLEVVFSTHLGNGNLYALNGENGSLLWKFYTGGPAIDSSVRLHDIDNDSQLEVIFTALSPYVEGAGLLFALRGEDGSVLWNYTMAAVSLGGAAIEDMDGDNRPEVIIGTVQNATGGYVHIINAEDGSLSSSVGPFQGDICSNPAVLDVNCDGFLDIVIATQEGDNSVCAINGPSLSILWRYQGESSFRGGCAYADLDNDAIQELVIGSTDGHIHAINAEDGSSLWTYAGNSSYYATCIADLGRVFGSEIVAIGEREVLVLNGDGEPSWSYSHGATSISYPLTTPSISDLDGNGIADICFPDSQGVIEVRDGDSGIILHFNASDSNPLGTMGVYHSPIIADFDGDDFLDIFIVAGKGDSSNPIENYGQAYVFKGSGGSGGGWLMDRHDGRNSACFNGYSHLVRITGHVEDGENHSSIAGARISTVGGKVSATTDLDGDFSLNLYPGFTTLVVEADGYEPRLLSVTILDAEGQSFVFRLSLQTTESATIVFPTIDPAISVVLAIVVTGIVIVMVAVRRLPHG
ncbi:MAG: hypothetical protein C4K48_09820 [Candidatus Thorarchaeota archaeon]|nr:MAG: hypothetical protein C4K48_09820 [Candidatus Thorarchaeota archaeon]